MLTLGEKIRVLRKQKNISQCKLAKEIGLSKTYLCNIESGQQKNASTRVLTLVSAYFGVTISYLIDEKSSLTKDIKGMAFMKKFQSLNDRDKKRISDIIDLWLKESRVG